MFLAVQTLRAPFFLTVPNFVVFFKLLDRKYKEDSKNVLKTVIFSLQVSLTGNFVFDRQTVLKSCKNWGLEKFSSSIQFVFLRFITVILTVVT